MTAHDRRCLPPEEWPEADRRAWEQALAPAGLLDDAGHAAHWRPTSRLHSAKTYGRWIGFLRGAHPEMLELPAPERATAKVLSRYIERLERDGLAPFTVFSYLASLRTTLKVLSDPAKVGLLDRVVAQRRRSARPTAPRAERYRPLSDLLNAATKEMEESESRPCRRPTDRAGWYRNGLALYILATRSLRISNLAAMRIGRELDRVGERYALIFDDSQMKNHRPLEQLLPRSATPWIERYLERHRPVLLGGKHSDWLWLSYLGEPLHVNRLRLGIQKVTKRHLGIAISPHLVRHIAATTTAIQAPSEIHLAAAVLHHADTRTVERHYNLATGMSAARSYHGMLKRLRSESRERE